MFISCIDPGGNSIEPQVYGQEALICETSLHSDKVNLEAPYIKKTLACYIFDMIYSLSRFHLQQMTSCLCPLSLLLVKGQGYKMASPCEKEIYHKHR